jgi:hypothetical protein
VKEKALKEARRIRLIPERVKALVENLPQVFQRVRSEILDFAQFLENLSGADR